MATNNPPSASQEEEYRTVRADGVRRLAHLEATIGELQQTLEGMLAERDELAWKVEHHSRVLNPVRRVPAEILREIFLFACTRSTERPYRCSLCPPTFLAAVCRSWNHIIATFPQLWRECKFIMPAQTRGNNYHGIDQGVKAYWLWGLSVSRSALCPLWLDLRLDSFSYSVIAYPCLLSISSRIQRLRISTNNLGLLESPDFLHFVDGLTTMVYMDLCMETDSIVSSASAIRFPRSLRHLVVTPYAAFCRPEVDFNWSRLESLTLRTRYVNGQRDVTSIRFTVAILSRIPNLRCLAFSDDYNYAHTSQQSDHDIAAPTSITLARLTDLLIDSMYDVLTYISTPTLERLIIKGVRARSGLISKLNNVDAVDALIRRCRSIRELSLLTVFAESMTQLLASLQSLPQLRVVALDICYVRDLRARHRQRDMANEIIAFLESCRRLPDAPNADTRATSCADLESFTLHAPLRTVFDFDEAQHERIRALRASGLLFYICRYAEKDPRNY